jgi:hypothetical protein
LRVWLAAIPPLKSKILSIDLPYGFIM